MPSLPRPKVGIVACAGEEIAQGTVTRLAALKLLHDLRPDETVTICLPLFLAGGEGDRAFAKVHPTITVDGCRLRCAAIGTETYSAKPVASIVVDDLAAECGIAGIDGRRRLNAAGQRAVEVTASRLAGLVDDIVGDTRAAEPPAQGAPAVAAATEPASRAPAPRCSCQSGLPAMALNIQGARVEVVALRTIFEKMRETNRPPGGADVTQDLLDVVKVYNFVPPDAEGAWREALAREYAAFWERGGRR